MTFFTFVILTENFFIFEYSYVKEYFTICVVFCISIGVIVKVIFQSSSTYKIWNWAHLVCTFLNETIFILSCEYLFLMTSHYSSACSFFSTCVDPDEMLGSSFVPLDNKNLQVEIKENHRGKFLKISEVAEVVHLFLKRV